MNIRQQFRQRRRAVTGEARQLAEHKICTQLESVCAGAALVGAYAAFDAEPSLEGWLASTNIAIALPKITEKRGEMTLHLWRPDDPQSANEFGITEPSVDALPVEPARLDIILVPLVAFDDHGTRLGMGAGYYDRYLVQAERAIRVGIAFTCQRSETPLPRQAWDQPLNQVVTEDGITYFEEEPLDGS